MSSHCHKAAFVVWFFAYLHIIPAEGFVATWSRLLTATTTRWATATTLDQSFQEVTLTQRILEVISPEVEAGGAGGASSALNTWESLLRADTAWISLKSGGHEQLSTSSAPYVRTAAAGARVPMGVDHEFDVVVCGGTLGVFVAAAIAVRSSHSVSPLRIAILERAPELRGRAQEWNLSLKELQELVVLGVLNETDLDGAVGPLDPGQKIARSPDPDTLIATHFTSVRVGCNSREDADHVDFPLGAGFGRPVSTDTQVLRDGRRVVDTGGTGRQELRVEGVLNIGVRPDVAIQRARRSLEKATNETAQVFEGTAVKGIEVFEDGALLATSRGRMKAKLVVDCMGHASPAVRQVRQGQSPDGVCLVVGTCSSGFGASSLQSDTLRPTALANDAGDLIYTNEDMTTSYEGGAQQYFWEAFPAGASDDLRTTYLFTYVDARPGRPSLIEVFEDYWVRLRKYQGIEPDPSKSPGFVPKRALFAFFPTFRQRSPLPSSFDRLLHAGDASGVQSPLSFGGFSALTRHLGRLSGAVVEALEADCLDKESLSAINPYLPGLSATWMFQRSMTARPIFTPEKDFVNRLMSTNFDVMNDRGDKVLLPFLKDVIQLSPLVETLLGATARDPLFIPQILRHVGAAAVAEWSGHVAMLAIYTVLHHALGSRFLAATENRNASDLSTRGRLSAAGAADNRDFIKAWADRLTPFDRFMWRRRAESWMYGSGLDFERGAPGL